MEKAKYLKERGRCYINVTHRKGPGVGLPIPNPIDDSFRVHNNLPVKKHYVSNSIHFTSLHRPPRRELTFKNFDHIYENGSPSLSRTKGGVCHYGPTPKEHENRTILLGSRIRLDPT